MSGAIGNPRLTAVAVILFAVVQILVHTVCFLHVNTAGGGRAGRCSPTSSPRCILLITIAGSLWIMYHLNTQHDAGHDERRRSSETP